MGQRADRVALGAVLFAAIASLALAGCGSSGSAPGKTSSKGSDPAPAVYKVTPALLKTSASPSDGSWKGPWGQLANGRRGSGQRPLLDTRSINTGNAAKLHLVWQSSYSPIMSPAGVDGGPASRRRARRSSPKA